MHENLLKPQNKDLLFGRFTVKKKKTKCSYVGSAFDFLSINGEFFEEPCFRKEPALRNEPPDADFPNGRADFVIRVLR